MKPIPALLLNLVVVALGLFAYDRWFAAAEDRDPLAPQALENLERQMQALSTRRGPKGDPRGERMRQQLQPLLRDVPPERHDRVFQAIQRSMAARARVVRDPALAAWSRQEFERRYRAAIEPAVNEIRVVVGDSGLADAIIQRFVYDGRPIVKPVPPGGGPNGEPK